MKNPTSALRNRVFMFDVFVRYAYKNIICTKT